MATTTLEKPEDKVRKAAQAGAVAAGAKGTRKLHPSRFKLAQHARNVWSVVPEHGTKFEALLEPSYWAHLWERMRPTDRIEVNAEDGSYYAELFVRAVGKMSVKVAVLSKTDFDISEQKDMDPKFDVIWRGPHHKYTVMRLSDNQPIQPGFDNKDDGLKWLSVNIRSLI